jgi:hypothetical protein
MFFNTISQLVLAGSWIIFFRNRLVYWFQCFSTPPFIKIVEFTLEMVFQIFLNFFVKKIDWFGVLGSTLKNKKIVF